MSVVEITEKQFQAQVIDLLRIHGWRHYHTYRSKRSPAGFPDLVIARERLMFIELKGPATAVTRDQRSWIIALRAAGGEAYIVRPCHLDDLAIVLGHRSYEYRPAQWEHRVAAAHKRLVDFTSEVCSV